MRKNKSKCIIDFLTKFQNLSQKDFLFWWGLERKKRYEKYKFKNIVPFFSNTIVVR